MKKTIEERFENILSLSNEDIFTGSQKSGSRIVKEISFENFLIKCNPTSVISGPINKTINIKNYKIVI